MFSLNFPAELEMRGEGGGFPAGGGPGDSLAVSVGRQGGRPPLIGTYLTITAHPSHCSQPARCQKPGDLCLSIAVGLC